MLMVRPFLVICSLLLMVHPLAAKELPSQIKYLYEESEEFGCKIVDGSFQILKLQGDNVNFFVIDSSKIPCKKTAFCGSGGCGLEIYVEKFGSYKKIFDDLVQGHFFKKSKKGYELFVERKTVGTARYRFDSKCAKEVGKNDDPLC